MVKRVCKVKIYPSTSHVDLLKTRIRCKINVLVYSGGWVVEGTCVFLEAL